MADITMLILTDHDWFRDQFAKLDDLQAQTPINQRALERVWRPLADKLDVHAYIEEKIFYPQLLQRGADDPEGETLDAIGDHNDIRDGVRDANAAQIGTEPWWTAVGRTRLANDDHMGEEEREGLGGLSPQCADRSPRSARPPIQRIHGLPSHHQRARNRRPRPRGLRRESGESVQTDGFFAWHRQPERQCGVVISFAGRPARRQNDR
jgi:hypothetical protein